MRDNIWKFIAVFFCLWAIPAWAEWQRLEDGFEYQSLEGGSVHLVRVDPSRFRFDLMTARDYHQPALTASEYAQKSGAILAINGGFFDPAFRSLGLLVRRGKEINPIRRNNWGIFQMKNGQMKNGDRPSIIHQQSWNSKASKDIVLAIEAGPRLIVNGMVPKFRESGPERRSAIGISSEGDVVIAVSEKLMTLTAWAAQLKPYCVEALNFDGGGSTQLSLHHASKELVIEGWTPVPNVLVVARPL